MAAQQPHLRYLTEPRAGIFAARGLAVEFPTQIEFDSFVNQIQTDEAKDSFLRVASMYHFLVKNGDWHVQDPDSDPVVDYFTDSYKLVFLFSLIESLGGNEYKDFYQWLRGLRGVESPFPIADPASLATLNDRYLTEHGSTRRCVAFFSRLDEQDQRTLLAAFRNVPFDNGRPTLEQIAKYLYNLRSKFVHSASLVLCLGPVQHYDAARRLLVRLDMAALQRMFERGLVKHFTT